MDPLKSESVPVAKLLGMGAPYNPRRIEPEQLAALRRSLRTFGAVEPVVANKRSGLIVGGHVSEKLLAAIGCWPSAMKEPANKTPRLDDPQASAKIETVPPDGGDSS